MQFLRRLAAALTFFVLLLSASALEKISRNPYVGAIVVDSDTGQVLFEDGADVVAYPASVTKLMTFAVVMDRVIAGQLSLEAPVTVSAEAARTGGSQVYLKHGEVFSIDDLLVALIVSSANDAAVALAVHVGGSREAFVALMNEKARELGMAQTRFTSPHGLPPSRGQEPDVSTARDLALLSRHLIQHDRVLAYSSIKVRMLREQSATPFEMRSHNHLLGKFAGCDGLKTGYFSAGGFSLSATAERNGRRLIAVTLGSETSKMRDFKVMELLERGFAHAPAMPNVQTTLPTVRPAPVAAPPATKATVTLPAARPPSAIPVLKTDEVPAGDAASTSAIPPVTFRVIPPTTQPKKK
ncbi:MAG: D-alanyl-D-alanine carboxypeptidase family protein [Candidatus Didemnitutus sp.]|nr:D-alanyl-D-alanine carboxypeptidase family protein [Candidatus Didemnitutus sp.]